MHAGTREILKRVAGQNYLHVALVNVRTHADMSVVALHEFKNDFGFFDVHSYAQASAEQGWPEYSFDEAYAAYQRDFEMSALLHGRYSDRTLLAGDAP
jgi:hypothetical protein